MHFVIASQHYVCEIYPQKKKPLLPVLSQVCILYAL